MVLAASSWSAPFPPPEVMQAFGEIDHSFPERIMTLAEEEAAHRRSLERDWQRAQIDDAPVSRDERRRGQLLGFWLALIAILAATTAALMDREVFGTAVVAVAVGSLAVAFVTGRVVQSRHAKRGDGEQP